VVICLERGADLHMAQLMPLPLTVSCSSKIHIGFTFLVPALPFWYRLTRLVPDKGPLNGCVCVCVCALIGWLGGRKGIRPVKKLCDVVLVWLSVWSKVQTCIWPS